MPLSAKEKTKEKVAEMLASAIKDLL